jgi:excisionase family DNA binding protein
MPVNHPPSRRTTPPRGLVRLDTAAEQFDCSVRTIRRMIASGAITGYRVGPRMLRVDLQEIDAVVRRVPTVRQQAGDRP